MRKTCFVLCVGLLVMFASGCGRFTEVDETAFVFTLTADKGEQNELKIGARIPVPRLIGKIQGGAVGAGGGPGQELYLNTSVQAPSLQEAIPMMQIYTGRHLSLEHVRIMVISEALARMGIEEIIRPLMRDPDIRSTTLLYISRGDPFRVIQENNPVLEVNTAKFIDLVARLEKEHGFTTATQLGGFFSQLTADGASAMPVLSINEPVSKTRKAVMREKAGGPAAPTSTTEEDRKAKHEFEQQEANQTLSPARTPGSYLPGHLPREDGNPLDFMGLAVFRGYEMVGMFNGNSTLAYNILTGRFGSGVLSVPEPGNPKRLISVNIYKGREPHLEFDLSGPVPVLRAKITLEADYIVVISHQPVEHAKKQLLVEAEIASQIARFAEAAIRDTQEWDADIFGFTRRARRQFPTIEAWRDYNWKDTYKNARLDIQVSVNIRRPGLITGATYSNR